MQATDRRVSPTAREWDAKSYGPCETMNARHVSQQGTTIDNMVCLSSNPAQSQDFL